MKLKTLKDIKYDKLFAPFPNKPSIEPPIEYEMIRNNKPTNAKAIKLNIKALPRLFFNFCTSRFY